LPHRSRHGSRRSFVAEALFLREIDTQLSDGGETSARRANTAATSDCALTPSSCVMTWMLLMVEPIRRGRAYADGISTS
jgi:hypothetical protein